MVPITGASRGPGAAIACTLGAAGMRLVLADIAVQRVLDFAAVLAERDIDAIALPLDVSDPVQCVEAIDRMAQRFGRLDALINNTAIDVTTPADGFSPADWQRIVACNLRAPFMLSNHAVALMAQQRQGHVVSITSATRRGWHGATAHPAAPDGPLGRSQCLHAQLRPLGIRVTTVVANDQRLPGHAGRSVMPASHALHNPLRVAQQVRVALQQMPDTGMAKPAVPSMREFPRAERVMAEVAPRHGRSR